MIKVLLERSVKKEKCLQLLKMLRELRAETLNYPGYISGETLIDGDNNIVNTLVISTWISEECWKAWLTSQQRIELENIIDALLEGEPRIRLYRVSLD